MHAVADLRATLDTLVTTGAVAVGVGVTLLAIFADPRPKAKVKEEQDNSFKWGLMGGISCLPLFNWMSWVLAALEDEERARVYYAFAALYAVPLLHSGFDIDGFSITMLAVGAAHVQAERIAATEPETQSTVARALAPLSILKTIATASRAAAAALVGPGAARRGELPPGGGRGWDELVEKGRDREPEALQKTRSDEIVEEIQARELAEFDQRLRERDARRQRGGG